MTRLSRAQLLQGITALAGGVLLGCGDGGETANDDDGGTNAGGSNAGGSNAGGMNAGGMNAGGSTAGACGLALLVRGSNYATDPHDITIPLADLEAGVTKTYTSTGNGHTHDVEITAADFEALRNGQTVTKTSCFAVNTDHEWLISCADPNIMSMNDGNIC